jgi:hypothetical protein
MRATSGETVRWRAPRWLLIIGYVVTVVVPFFGQVIGFVLGVVLVILPHRRRHGVLLVVLSILMVIIWLLIAASGGGGSNGNSIPFMCC